MSFCSCRTPGEFQINIRICFLGLLGTESGFSRLISFWSWLAWIVFGDVLKIRGHAEGNILFVVVRALSKTYKRLIGKCSETGGSPQTVLINFQNKCSLCVSFWWFSILLVLQQRHDLFSTVAGTSQKRVHVNSAWHVILLMSNQDASCIQCPSVSRICFLIETINST